MDHQLSIAFQTDKPLSAYGPLAAQAEALGFSHVSVYNDLFYQPAWYPLLEMARHTERIHLGPAAVNPFTCHPITIAGQVALLAEAAPGRVYLGLARGAWLEDIGLFPKRPVMALREAFAAVRHLLRRDPAPLDGRIFPIAEGARLNWDDPHNDVPFLLGSWGPRTIRACLPFIRAVKLGGTANPDLVRQVRAELPAQVALVAGAVTVVDTDGDAARTLARREVALYLPVVAELDPTVELEPERLRGLSQAAVERDYAAAAGFVSDNLLRRFAFAGTPAEIAEQVQDLFAAGVQRVEFGTPHGLSPETGLELLGKEVLPLVSRSLA